jgi:hypothetical protein
LGQLLLDESEVCKIFSFAQESFFLLKLRDLATGGVQGPAAAPESPLGRCHFLLLLLPEALEDLGLTVVQPQEVLAPAAVEVAHFGAVQMADGSPLCPLLLEQARHSHAGQLRLGPPDVPVVLLG